MVAYLNNQQVVASLTALSFREIVTCIMSCTPTADPPVNTEDNSTTSDQPVAQLPTGLSAEDVQRIASAVAALVGRPSTSNNPLVSGPCISSLRPTYRRYAICFTLSNHLAS